VDGLGQTIHIRLQHQVLLLEGHLVIQQEQFLAVFYLKVLTPHHHFIPELQRFFAEFALEFVPVI
jgi:hypothetical protein